VAIFHCSTKPVARSTGRSAVAAASYRSGERLADERLGTVHDYTRRSGVEDRELVLPEAAGEDWTREKLWNEAEHSEIRKDARTAREWEVAFPAELSAEGRKAAAVDFAHSLANQYGCAVDIALHSPGAKGDQRNFHAHLLTTTREVGAGSFGEKTTLELSNTKREKLNLGTSQAEIERIRARWADFVNQQLEREGHKERIDHRSLVAQKQAALERGDLTAASELDRTPLPRLTRNVMQIERWGIRTDSGDRRREVEEANAARREMREVGKELAVIEAREKFADKRETAAEVDRRREEFRRNREAAKAPQQQDKPKEIQKPRIKQREEMER
jgi:hypothetical protein